MQSTTEIIKNLTKQDRKLLKLPVPHVQEDHLVSNHDKEKIQTTLSPY